MKDFSENYESDCREYCEPLHQACLNSGEGEERCAERFEQCLSFCEFA